VVQGEYLEDYVNFRTFPTVAARYANILTASLGTRSPGDDRAVGVIGAGKNTNYGVFAIYLNETKRDVNSAILGFATIEQAQLDISWAKEFGATAVGGAVLYTKSSVELGQEKETPIGGGSQDLDSPNANQLAITGGVKIDMNNTSILELAAQVGWWSWEETDVAGDVVSEDAGNLSYGLAGRIMAEISDQTTLVPLVRFGKMDLTEEPDPAATEEDVTRTMMNLGLAMHHEVNGNDLLVMGVSADYMKDKDGLSEYSRWALPSLFAALEFDVYRWLTVRTGARKTFNRFKDDSVDPELDWLNSDFSFGLGMGLHFDHFDVDAVIDESAIFTGGYLFSGESSQPLTKVTATYYF
jgi:hypothetical protein